MCLSNKKLNNLVLVSYFLVFQKLPTYLTKLTFVVYFEYEYNVVVPMAWVKQNHCTPGQELILYFN